MSFYTCYLCQDTEVTSLQTRLQAGLVERLEEQLGQERARLGAMLDHLHQSPVSPHPRTRAPSHLLDHPHLARDQSPASSSQEQRPPQTYATMIRQVET